MFLNLDVRQRMKMFLPEKETNPNSHHVKPCEKIPSHRALSPLSLSLSLSIYLSISIFSINNAILMQRKNFSRPSFSGTKTDCFVFLAKTSHMIYQLIWIHTHTTHTYKHKHRVDQS